MSRRFFREAGKQQRVGLVRGDQKNGAGTGLFPAPQFMSESVEYKHPIWIRAARAVQAIHHVFVVVEDGAPSAALVIYVSPIRRGLP